MARLRPASGAWMFIACAVTASAAQTQDAVMPAPYATLAAEATDRVTFDALPRRAEPGIAFNAPMRLGGLWLAERFAGQSLQAAGPFDLVTQHIRRRAWRLPLRPCPRAPSRGRSEDR